MYFRTQNKTITIMDYISFNKNVNCLPKAKFDDF